jgi:hypothetical protein
VIWRSFSSCGSSPVGRPPKLLEHSPVKSAQFGCRCRKVGERAGNYPHVVVEYVPIDVVDAVTSLVIAGVIALADLPAPCRGLPAPASFVPRRQDR